MDAEFVARKASFLAKLRKIADECQALADDNNYFAGLPQSGEPIDMEGARVLGHAAREAIRHVEADEPIPERFAKVLFSK